MKTSITKEEIEKLSKNTELKTEQDKIVKLKTYDLNLFIGQKYFVSNRAQLYIIFQRLYYTLLKTRWYWESCFMEI